MLNQLAFDELADAILGLPDETKYARANRFRYRASWDEFSLFVRRYYPRYRNVPGSTFESLLRNSPIVGPPDLQNHINDFLSDLPRLNRRNQVAFQTSGTTGRPIRIPRDPVSAFDHCAGAIEAIFRNTGIQSHFLSSRNVAVATLSLNPRCERTAYLSPIPNPGWLITLGLTGVPSLDANRLRILNDAKPVAVFARPSVLQYVLSELNSSCRWIDSIEAVLCGGERLYDSVAADLRTSLGRPIFDIFATQECGLVCWRESQQDLFEVFGERMHVSEATDLNRTHECRLLFTSRSNLTLPLIKYATGDTGTVLRINGKSYLRKGLGRDKGTFKINGLYISDSGILHVIRNFYSGSFDVIQREQQKCELALLAHRAPVDFHLMAASAFAKHFGVPVQHISKGLIATAHDSLRPSEVKLRCFSYRAL